jgi:peroxiredoxin
MLQSVHDRRPVRPGEPAPEFKLPAADREGVVALADYRGRSPVLLTLLRGLYCPFCRRHIAHLGATADKLRAAGVATVGVVATAAERARLYFRFRPSRFPLGSDPDLATHRAFGVPKVPLSPEIMDGVEAAASRLVQQLGAAVGPGGAHKTLGTLDGFEPLPSDLAEAERQGAQLVGQFLIDRDGVVRWAFLEGERGAPDPTQVPSDEELLAVARAL